MFALRKVLQENAMINVSTRMFGASIYDIQDKTTQELSPYTKKPTNIFYTYVNTDRKQLEELTKNNSTKKNAKVNKDLLKSQNFRINGLNSLH